VPGDPAPADGLVIRDARVEDAAAVAALCGELGYHVTTSEAAARVSARRDAHMFVALRAAAVVGWIEVAEHSTVEGQAAEILALVVTAHARGQAIGSRLLAAGEAWARARGVPRMRVRSNVMRARTHGFYLERGYVERKRQVVFDKTLEGGPAR
jgi:GNAT superfamily N-acetyltransferase